jgi:hypothetical protein
MDPIAGRIKIVLLFQRQTNPVLRYNVADLVL